MSFSLLIIDDDEDIRLILTSVLNSVEGLEIYEAANGAEARTVLGVQQIDGIILDYRLPDLNGEELLTDLENLTDYKTPDVIMLSARDDQELQKQWLELGALAVMKKPFNPFELVTQVRSHFGF